MTDEIIDRKRREFLLIDGATHIDTYDRAQLVAPAVGELACFFGRHLADARGSK